MKCTLHGNPTRTRTRRPGQFSGSREIVFSVLRTQHSLYLKFIKNEDKIFQSTTLITLNVGELGLKQVSLPVSCSRSKQVGTKTIAASLTSIEGSLFMSGSISNSGPVLRQRALTISHTPEANVWAR